MKTKMDKRSTPPPPARPPDHVFAWRVAYADTDAGGVVYHSRYIEWAERARSGWAAELGFSIRRHLEEDGAAVAIRRIEADYLAPAYADDALEIRSWLVRVGGASMNFRQNIGRMDDDLNFVTLAALDLTAVCVKVSGDGAGRPVRAPEAFRAAAAALSPAD